MKEERIAQHEIHTAQQQVIRRNELMFNKSAFREFHLIN